MEDFTPNYGRRWYDRVPHMSRAVHISQQLPEPIQAVIARNLNEYIAHYQMRNHAAKQPSATTEVSKIMGLYSASKRRRWYDPDPHVRRAFNMMAIVPEPVLARFGQSILGAADYIEQRYSGPDNTDINPAELAQDISNLFKNLPEVVYQDEDQDMKISRRSFGETPSHPESEAVETKVFYVPRKNHHPNKHR